MPSSLASSSGGIIARRGALQSTGWRIPSLHKPQRRNGMETLQSMRLFVRVANSDSFSAAGRAFGLSPASVSRHVNALETQLGVRLVHRTSRQLALTEAGQL